MQRQKWSRRWRSRWLGLGLIGLLTISGFAVPYAAPFVKAAAAAQSRKCRRRPCAERTSGTVMAGGTVGSSNQTNIDCELKSLSAGVRGMSMVTNGAPPSSRWNPREPWSRRTRCSASWIPPPMWELVRQQKMTVERARSDHLQAKLDLEVAELAITQYRQGILIQTLEIPERANRALQGGPGANLRSPGMVATHAQEKDMRRSVRSRTMRSRSAGRISISSRRCSG